MTSQVFSGKNMEVKLAMCIGAINIKRGGYKFQRYDKVGKGAKIRNQYNKVPHLTQDTNPLFGCSRKANDVSE